jgi:hypothetical protein
VGVYAGRRIEFDRPPIPQYRSAPILWVRTKRIPSPLTGEGAAGGVLPLLVSSSRERGFAVLLVCIQPSETGTDLGDQFEVARQLGRVNAA